MKKLISLCILFALPAAAADRLFSVKPGSTLSYTLVHKLHEVKGTSKEVEGKVKLNADGSVVLQLRAPVGSFDSANGNRDVHMKETVDAAKFPMVDFKGLSPRGSVAANPTGSAKIAVKGKLTFHGVTQDVASTFDVTFTDATHMMVKGSFPISLEGYGIERPSLLTVKVEDKVQIDTNLTLEASAK